MKRSSTRGGEAPEGPLVPGEIVEIDGKKMRYVGRGLYAGKLRHVLSSLRIGSGITQVEMARRMGVAQAQVSRIESGSDPRVSTLERYIAALGGKLRLEADMGDRRYWFTLEPPRRIEDGEEEAAPATTSRKASPKAKTSAPRGTTAPKRAPASRPAPSPAPSAKAKRGERLARASAKPPRGRAAG